MYLAARPLGLGQPGPAPAPAKPAKVRLGPTYIEHPTKLTCTAAQLQAIEAILGRKVDVAALRAELETLAHTAARLASQAAMSLDRDARTSATVELFKGAFGVPPNNVPSWRPAGQHWDRGDVVRRRLIDSARLLYGGHIRWRCANLNKANCWDAFSCQSPNRFSASLGRKFWEAVRDKNAVNTAGVLLASALFTAFGPLIGPGSAKRFTTIGCYLRFLFRANGLTLTPEVERLCTSPPSAPAAPGGAAAPSGTPAPGGPRLPTPREAAEDWVRRHPRTIDDEIQRMILDAKNVLKQAPAGRVSDQIWERASRPLDRLMAKVGLSKATRDRVVKKARQAVEGGAEKVMTEALAAEGIRGEAGDALTAIVRALLNSRAR